MGHCERTTFAGRVTIILRFGCAALLIIGIIILGSGACIIYSLKSQLAPRTVLAGPVSNTQPLTEFRAYPVYWLGMEYDGLPLTVIHVRPFGEPYTVVGYGYCGTRGGLDGGSCNPPILILQQPPCTIGRSRTSSYESGRYVWRDGVGVYVLLEAEIGGPASKTAQVQHDLVLANDAYFSPTPLSGTETFHKKLDRECSTAAPPAIATPTPP